MDLTAGVVEDACELVADAAAGAGDDDENSSVLGCEVSFCEGGFWGGELGGGSIGWIE